MAVRIDWSERYPRPLLDKLGVRDGARVTILSLDDGGFARRLEERTTDISAQARQKTDLVFLGVKSVADLDRLAALRKTLQPAGAIWVVRVKGEAAVVKETEATHSALKLVIPVALR